MSDATYRQPTVKEAVEFMMMPSTREYRRRCLEYWKEHFGETFEIAVRKEFVSRWRRRRTQRQRAL